LHICSKKRQKIFFPSKITGITRKLAKPEILISIFKKKNLVWKVSVFEICEGGRVRNNEG
jgi:hypothetical protein